jgi:hypothetical protein
VKVIAENRPFTEIRFVNIAQTNPCYSGKVPQFKSRGSGEENHHDSVTPLITKIMLRDEKKMGGGLSRGAWLRENPV